MGARGLGSEEDPFGTEVGVSSVGGHGCRSGCASVIPTRAKKERTRTEAQIQYASSPHAEGVVLGVCRAGEYLPKRDGAFRK